MHRPDGIPSFIGAPANQPKSKNAEGLSHDQAQEKQPGRRANGREFDTGIQQAKEE